MLKKLEKELSKAAGIEKSDQTFLLVKSDMKQGIFNKKLGGNM